MALYYLSWSTLKFGEGWQSLETGTEPQEVKQNVVQSCMCMLTETFSDLWHYKSGNTFINTINKKGNRLDPCENAGEVCYATPLQYRSNLSQLNQFNVRDIHLVTMDQQNTIEVTYPGMRIVRTYIYSF